MKLHTSNLYSSIPVSEMEDGQVGIITEWDNAYTDSYIGMIIQQFKGQFLISLQKDSGNIWNPIPKNKGCRVRILQKGETLIIE